MERHILIADDSQQTCEQLVKLLTADGGYQVDAVTDGRSALQALKNKPYDLFLTDLKMPGIDGMKLIEEIHQRHLSVLVIVMTGYGSIDQAVQAMRLGARDFLTKPLDFDHLRLVLDRALREQGLKDEVSLLREQLAQEHSFHNVLSKSLKMQAIFELIQNVAETTTTVLIEGETGTGKEQVARALHRASMPFRKGPLVAVNCAALPENLLESELFGHEKGAFTGAVSQRKGRFELADGGTLFLDEVGDIPAGKQAKLLRVLQERQFERVGGTESIEVDVRVVAATNRSLTRLAKRGKFREDLYYRLNVVKIELPPLRDRPEDIPLLSNHFATKYARPAQPPKEISPEAMEKLLEYSWPGNIRELENVMERASITARGPQIEPDDLAPELLATAAALGASPLQVDLSRPLPQLLKESAAALERAYLRKALKRASGHIGRCARLCGLSRRSISAKLSAYGIEKEDFKNE